MKSLLVGLAVVTGSINATAFDSVLVGESKAFKIYRTREFEMTAHVGMEQYRDMLYRYERTIEKGTLAKNEAWQSMILRLKKYKAKNESDAELSGSVNSWINGFIDYTKDKIEYNMNEYWASPLEILERGRGDCDDYAILKYYLLREVVPEENLMLAYVKTYADTESPSGHLVTLVRTQGQILVLDNMTEYIVTIDEEDESNYQITTGYTPKGQFQFQRKK